MRTLLTVIGAVLLGMGLLFCGQGLGLIRWPAESFMINEVTWAYYGGGMAVLGTLIIVLTRL
jgi:hypothetical protein